MILCIKSSSLIPLNTFFCPLKHVLLFHSLPCFILFCLVLYFITYQNNTFLFCFVYFYSSFSMLIYAIFALISIFTFKYNSPCCYILRYQCLLLKHKKGRFCNMIPLCRSAIHSGAFFCAIGTGTFQLYHNIVFPIEQKSISAKDSGL